MGCGSSQPEIKARTANSGIWDDDFKLPPKPKINAHPQLPSHLPPSYPLQTTTGGFNLYLTSSPARTLPSVAPPVGLHEQLTEKSRPSELVPGNNNISKSPVPSSRHTPVVEENRQGQASFPSHRPQHDHHQRRNSPPMARLTEISGVSASPQVFDNTSGHSLRSGGYKDRAAQRCPTTNMSNNMPTVVSMPNPKGVAKVTTGTKHPSNHGVIPSCPTMKSHRGPPPSLPNSSDKGALGLSNHRRFEDCYSQGQDLGKGAFAQVFIGMEYSTGQKYAVKRILDRKKMRWNGRDALMDEIGNLRRLRQAPNIVYLHEYFLEENQCYLVMELLPGKELFERIIQKKTFTEEEARNSCRSVLNALAYMHDRRITHRDLKPENILLVDEMDIDKVKLSDFGFSKYLQTSNECRTLCGTPGYLAPEILERWPAYDVKCDTWSFGVVLFLLLGGYLPFDSHGSNDKKQIFERTRNGQYCYYPQRWAGISRAAKDLVAKCLTVSPSKRISAQMALAHEWMGEGLALPSTMISAESLASAYHETKRNRKDHDKATFLKELNDDFTVYMGERQGDSILSAMTGHGAGPGGGGGGRSVASCHSNFQEDSISGKPFSHFYTQETLLAKGGFAQVYRCRHKDRPGISYAVKKVDMSNASKAEAATLREEITVLKYLRGAPHIIRLYDVFQEGQVTYLVLEEMKGGNLLQRIIDKEVYTEREARKICKILFSAVNFCHAKRIAHRDINVESLLLQEKDNDASMKLADFGFAKKVNRSKALKTILGTPKFMAPEIYGLCQGGGGYDHRCDLWSVGVVVYCLLGGYLPFEGSVKELSVLVRRGEYAFHEEYWTDVSPSAKQLIRDLLQVDPNNRQSAQQAMSSPWMAMDNAELSVMDLSSTKSRMERMVGTGTEKFKNAALAIIGVNKLQAAAGLKTSVLQNSGHGSTGSTEEQQTYLMESALGGVGDPDVEVCFEDVYEIGQPIGVGNLAKIHSAKNLLSNKEYSVKKVIRRQLHPADVAALNDEIAVLQEIAHGGKNRVVCLYEVYEDPDATYLVLERIRGDILIDRLIQKRKYTEFDAKELVRNLLQGVHHCHQKSIAIRNLTLDNLLLPMGSESDVIITDFEIAKKVWHRNSLKTQCGTQEFIAPEVLENHPQYDVSCDIWAVGVIVFVLLGGYYPFCGETETELLKNVRYGNFEFRTTLWKGITEDAKALVRSMLTVNPDDRITARAALTHTWVKADNSALSADLLDNVAEMKEYVARIQSRRQDCRGNPTSPVSQ